VRLFGADGAEINGYHGLGVSGRCGRLQPDRSAEVMTVGPIGQPMVAYEGLLFDETEWDGSDVFLSVTDSGYIFIVDAVRRALESAKVKGVVFERVDRYERWFR
jgi:hypothetical protein